MQVCIEYTQCSDADTVHGLVYNEYLLGIHRDNTVCKKYTQSIHRDHKKYIKIIVGDHMVCMHGKHAENSIILKETCSTTSTSMMVDKKVVYKIS